jgi:hypothetical protein
MIRINRIGKSFKSDQRLEYRADVESKIIRLPRVKPPKKEVLLKPFKQQDVWHEETKNPSCCLAVFNRFPGYTPVNRPLTVDDAIEIPGRLVRWKCFETRCTIQLLDMDHSPVAILTDGMSIRGAFENFRFNPKSIELGEVDYALKITERRLICPPWKRWFNKLFNRGFEWQKIGVEKLHTDDIRFIVYLEELLKGVTPED